MIIETYSYGLCLFSYDKLISFLSYNKKNRIKKLLDFFEKNHNFYLQSIKEGIWIPITKINSGKYEIKILDNKKYENSNKYIFQYDNFNIQITDNSLWICDIGEFLNFDKEVFKEKDELFYYTLDNKKITNAVKFPIPSGKYTVSIIGSIENDTPCFTFKFDAIDNFVGFNDPREDDKYPFYFG